MSESKPPSMSSMTRWQRIYYLVPVGALGIPFVANVEETFIFDMEAGVPFNIRLDGNCEILKMTVFEVDEGVV